MTTPRHQRPARLGRFLFGAPYYPEHWSVEDRAEDIDRMLAANINTVRMLKFAWDRIEPARGEFDFSLFDETIAKLHAAGIDTILCTPTAQVTISSSAIRELVQREGRRVVGKAEHLDKGANPRFVVPSLGSQPYPARALYEQTYCARGEMENRIKEQPLCLFADRTSTHWMRSNQIRLWLSSLGYVLVSALRRLGLAGTSMARARCDTIRRKLLKIGAAVRVSVRRVVVSLASGFPLQRLFRRICDRLRSSPVRRIEVRPLRC